MSSSHETISVDHALAHANLAEVYAYPPTTRGDSGSAYLRTNFVATLDGAAQGPNGLTGTINNDADHVVFDTLRELADVVIVGANTIRREGYRAIRLDDARAERRKALQLPPHPALLIMSGRLDVPDDLPEAGAGPVVVLTSEPADSPRAHALAEQGVEVISLAKEQLLPEMITTCTARGWTRLLSEGGPHLHGAMLAAGLVDELCLTLTPLVIGGDHLRVVAGVETMATFQIGSCFTTEDTVFLRMCRRGDASR